MDVRAAVETRYSCRAFLPDPIPESIVREIVARAARAPSGGNVQPWRVDAIAGERVAALKALLAPRMNELPRGEGTEYPVYPPGMIEPYRSRRFAAGALLYESIGVARDDRPARLAQYARNFEFFGAPAALFVSIDRTLGPAQWSDLGGFVQTVMLLARGYGLHTCAQEAWAIWHRTLSPFLALPQGFMLFCGIALGREDPAAPVNRWRTPRESLDSFATFAGFKG